MKKTPLILCLAIFSFYSSFAQDDGYFEKKDLGYPPQSFGMEIFQLFSNTMMLEYEYLFNNSNALHGGAGVTLKIDESEEIIGAIVDLQYRMYTIGDFTGLPLGLYIAPYAKFQTVDMKELPFDQLSDPTHNNYNILGAGFLVGFRTYALSKFYFDFNIGGGVKYSIDYKNLDPNYLGPQDLSRSGVIARSNLSIGMVF